MPPSRCPHTALTQQQCCSKAALSPPSRCCTPLLTVPPPPSLAPSSPYTRPPRRCNPALTQLHAALAQLHAALTPPSHRPHAAARSCSLSPPPPPPLRSAQRPHAAATQPSRRPHAAARALAPPSRRSKPSRRPRATREQPEAHSAAANDFVGGGGGRGPEWARVGMEWRRRAGRDRAG